MVTCAILLLYHPTLGNMGKHVLAIHELGSVSGVSLGKNKGLQRSTHLSFIYNLTNVNHVLYFWLFNNEN